MLKKAFSPQTKILFALIASGFFVICLITLLALNGLKYKYDTNLSSRAYKINFLQDVKNFYTKIVFLQKFENFSDEYQKMLTSWQHYKDFEEQDNALNTLEGIYQRLFLQDSIKGKESLDSLIIQWIATIDKNILQTPSLITQTKQAHNQNLLLHSFEMNSQIDTILQLQTRISFIQDMMTDSIYSTTLWFLCAFMALVVFGTLYFVALILRFIRNVNLNLQQIIQDQTQTLKQTNKNLQRTIDHEIEQSRKKDQIMYQQARLASMGEMIQNIAHQWRQPLNSLIILIQSFKIKYDRNNLSKEFVATQTADALRIAKNMSDTIENFRNFFHPNINKAKFSLSKSIEDSIGLIYPTLQQNNIQIYFDKKNDIEFFGYENAFSQIVLNLIKNSQDVFVESQIKEGLIELVLESIDSQVTLYIMDNGGGIKINDVNKIFEPYFTTKHKSVGTGIGLYMVKQIIEKQMNGSIEVKNQQWHSKTLDKNFYGAIFVIKFSLNSE